MKKDSQEYMGFILKCQPSISGVSCTVTYKGRRKPYLDSFAQFSDGPMGAYAQSRRKIERYMSR